MLEHPGRLLDIAQVGRGDRGEMQREGGKPGVLGLPRYGNAFLEQGPPEQIFGDPQEPRTREFLQRVIDAGRL